MTTQCIESWNSLLLSEERLLAKRYNGGGASEAGAWKNLQPGAARLRRASENFATLTDVEICLTTLQGFQRRDKTAAKPLEFHALREWGSNVTRKRASALTFDMRGAQKAQPFGHPLDGRVRRHPAAATRHGTLRPSRWRYPFALRRR